MKKVFSVLLAICLLSLNLCLPVSANGSAFVGSDNLIIAPNGSYNIASIKEELDKYDNLSSKATINSINEKFSTQIMEVAVYADNVEGLHDIYGFQFNVSVDSEEVVLAYAKTDLQSGDKVGYSLWGAFLQHQSSDYNKAIYLSYGNAPLTSDANNSVNKIEEGKYKIATLVFIVGNDVSKDFKITYDLTDVAAKDKNNKVLSVKDSFKSKTTVEVDVKSTAVSPSVTMLGAQIRSSGSQGIRFGAKLLKDSFYEDCTEISYGILIAVESHVKDKKELIIGNDEFPILNCENVLHEYTDDYLIFTGEITNFPLDGKYNNVNYIAKAYVQYKKTGSNEKETYYTDIIVRNVEQIESMLKQK